MKAIQMIILCTLMGMLSSYAQTIDKSLNRHDFFYAGEGKRIRMYIVKDGQVAWQYENKEWRGEISDAVLLTDGHVLLAHQYGIAEISQDEKTIWLTKRKTSTGVRALLK